MARGLIEATAVDTPTCSDAFSLLESAQLELRLAAEASEAGIREVAREFEGLAQHAGVIMQLATVMAGGVEDEKVQEVLPKAKALGETTRDLIERRLQTTAEIMKAIADEERLLRRLSQLSRDQKQIARQARVLSVMTRMEAGRLGQRGVGFEYLADELKDFSETMLRTTEELSDLVAQRIVDTGETRRVLEHEWPAMRTSWAHAQSELESALADVDRGLKELHDAPARFHRGASEIAGQIAGVVAAVQAQDITLQQMDHVRQALAVIQTSMRGSEQSGLDGGAGRSVVAGGLLIQTEQLRTARAAVGRWLEQISRCTDGILRVGGSEVAGIGPAVLAQERELALQLERMEELENTCRTGQEQVEKTFFFLSALTQMVGEHLTESQMVCNRLRLLTLNSIVQASHLGVQAAAIVEIAQSIKAVSEAWSGTTDESEQTSGEILTLIDQMRDGMEAFSQESTEAFAAAAAETAIGVAHLREVAELVAACPAEIERETDLLQDRIPSAAAAAERLGRMLTHLDMAVDRIESVRAWFPVEDDDGLRIGDAEELERLFSSGYTTDLERQVMRAVLYGGSPPPAEQDFAGNGVELF